MSNAKKNWTFDEVQALIQAVRKNPSLYDRRDPDYNQTRTKEVRFIWQKYGINLGILQKKYFYFVGHLEGNINKSIDHREKWYVQLI